jgi:anti-anti-sigma factor
MNDSALSGSDTGYVYCHPLAAGAHLALVGEIDLESRARLDEAYATVVAGPPGDIVIDLSATTFIDSTALGYFVRIGKHAARTGHRAVLRAPSGAVARVLRLSHVDRLLAVEPASGEPADPASLN